VSALQWRGAGPEGVRGVSAAAAAAKHDAMRRVEASIASHASAVVRESLAERDSDQRKQLLSAYMGPAAASAKRAVAAAKRASSTPEELPAVAGAANPLRLTPVDPQEPIETVKRSGQVIDATAFIGMNPMARRLPPATAASVSL
jgi:hypothetical protein